MDKLHRYEKPFADPDRRYAVYQIIHGGAADPALAKHYDALGFGGIVGNIPYTRAFPHDETLWQKTAEGMRAYIKRGMHTWIYDENGYPSGTAGGYVTEHHPAHIAKGLYCYDYWRQIGGPCVYRADVPDTKLWKAVLIPKDGGDPIDVTEALNENNVLYIHVPAGQYYLFMMSIRRLFDGTHATESYSEPRNYISLSDGEATRLFLDCTHEHYSRVLGDEFGRGVLAMFTDEPSLISWNIRTGVFPILPWLESYPADFEEAYGYPLWLACVAVVTGRGKSVVKRRCDYWEFIAKTVAEGYFGTIQKWCHAHGLKSSGHLLEEERLQAHIINYGSFFKSMRRLDWPGIDELNTETGPLMAEHIIPIARLAASFADISGEHEVFTEFSDHCVRERGEVAGKACYYGSVNWHLALGVNNFTSYYSWDGLTPEEIRDFNRYTARSGYLLRQGSRDSRVAVFYPEAAMWESYTPSTAARAVDSSQRTVALEEAFTRASWELLHRQIDFDYIDCDILLSAEIREGALCYRDRAYRAIVLPCARVLEEKAARKLAELADNGIAVFFCGEIPTLSRETGEALDDTIPAAIADGKMHVAETADFGALLDAALPDHCRPVRLTDSTHPMLLSHSRVTTDGVRVVYLANMDKTSVTVPVAVTGGYQSVLEADAHIGEMKPTAYEKTAHGVSFTATIGPGEGRFWLLA